MYAWVVRFKDRDMLETFRHGFRRGHRIRYDGFRRGTRAMKDLAKEVFISSFVEFRISLKFQMNFVKRLEKLRKQKWIPKFGRSITQKERELINPNCRLAYRNN